MSSGRSRCAAYLSSFIPEPARAEPPRTASLLHTCELPLVQGCLPYTLFLPRPLPREILATLQDQFRRCLLGSCVSSLAQPPPTVSSCRLLSGPSLLPLDVKTHRQRVSSSPLSEHPARCLTVDTHPRNIKEEW